MARKTAAGASASNEATVADVVKILEHIEWYCRQARLMLRQIDKKTPIKLTRELKAKMKESQPYPYNANSC